MKRIRTSLRNGERLAVLPSITLQDKPDLNRRCIYVDPSRTFQTHIGFGGALTRATEENLRAMGPEKAQMVIEKYFSAEKGIGYNLLRHTIASTDFGSYSYDYLPEGATDLSGYDFAEEKLTIEYGTKINKICPDIKRMATIWSAPAYMKSNRERNFGGQLRPECRKDWAEYMCLYLEHMKEAGLKVDMVTCQNEPEAKQLWESTHVSAEQEADLIKNYLVPALKRHGLEDTKIYIWDHNKDEMVRRANVTLADPEVDKLVSGIAYHWYVTNNYDNVLMAHDIHPDKAIIFTEGCVEWANAGYSGGEESKLSANKAAEKYGRDIIEGLNRHTAAFIDWNMVVNDEGGPTWVGNYCDAPVMFDRPSGEVIFRPAYYYIGQFSKFIQRGAKRVLCWNDFESNVYSTAYLNPNGDLVVVVMNTDWINEPVLLIQRKGATVTLPPHSITTFVIEKGELNS